MRDEALFINGVFESVLDEIVNVQQHLPEQVLYLQPYRNQRIVHLADRPPTADDPVRLFLSITSDIQHVHYVAEIVGWDDKRYLTGKKRELVEQVIRLLQPGEGGIYEEAGVGEAVNLLHVRRMKKLSQTFSVSELTLRREGRKLSEGRTTSGGWAYVENPGDGWLMTYL
jgi:hypothetical protein